MDDNTNTSKIFKQNVCVRICSCWQRHSSRFGTAQRSLSLWHWVSCCFRATAELLVTLCYRFVTVSMCICYMEWRLTVGSQTTTSASRLLTRCLQMTASVEVSARIW